VPAFAGSDLDRDDGLGIVVHRVGIARVFENLLHVVADGLGIVEFGDFVTDRVGVLAGGEAVDDEGVTLGEDRVVKGSGLLGSHDEGEARAAALPHPLDQGIGTGLGMAGRGEQVCFVEKPASFALRVGTSLGEACRGEQIEDLFVLVDSVIGPIRVELAEGVTSGELDDLGPLLSNMLACYRRFVAVFVDLVFVRNNRNTCFQCNAAVDGLLCDTCRSRIERLSGLFAELLPCILE
jgi:hypothetical protein